MEVQEVENQSSHTATVEVETSTLHGVEVVHYSTLVRALRLLGISAEAELIRNHAEVRITIPAQDLSSGLSFIMLCRDFPDCVKRKLGLYGQRLVFTARERAHPKTSPSPSRPAPKSQNPHTPDPHPSADREQYASRLLANH